MPKALSANIPLWNFLYGRCQVPDTSLESLHVKSISNQFCNFVLSTQTAYIHTLQQRDCLIDLPLYIMYVDVNRENTLIPFAPRHLKSNYVQLNGAIIHGSGRCSEHSSQIHKSASDILLWAKVCWCWLSPM